MTKHYLKAVFLFVLTCFAGVSTAQEQTSSSKWLPTTQVFEPLLFDPLEAQSYGTVARIANAGNSFNQDAYAPFAVGFSKGIWTKTNDRGLKQQVNVEFANFTQFEWLKNATERNMLNSDYKIGFSYQLGHNQWALRARWYHLSSHIGDDIIIRRGITNFETYKPSAGNYELLDVTGTYYLGDFRFYATLGAIARLNSPRQQFMFQFGTQWIKHWRGGDSPFHWIAGADVKSWQFTNYTPGVKYGAGIGYGEGRHTSVALLVEGYWGHLPYGQNEKSAPVYTNPAPAYPTAEWGGRVQWIGLGVYVNPVF